jgi:hypothetical protein
MIEELDRTIERLLEAEFPIRNGEIEIKFEQPSRTWSETKRNKKKPTLNLFLFDIRENNVLRQHQWEQVNELENGRKQFKRTPFRFDCHYMLTSWAENLADEHQILSQAMDALLRNPILPPTYLAGRLQHQVFDIQTRLASHDRLTNPAELWSALDNELRPSVSYVVTITKDPWQEQIRTAEEPVRTRHLHTYQRRHRPATAVDKVDITGQIRSARGPAADINVILTAQTTEQPWQYVAVTGENGRYQLQSVQPGNYLLTAWASDTGQAQEKVGERGVIVPAAIRIIAENGTFNIRIGREVALKSLHLTPDQAGYVETADFGPYQIHDVGHALPQNGIYHFGRVDPQRPPVAVIPAQTPGAESFRIAYRQEEEPIGNYDLILD